MRRPDARVLVVDDQPTSRQATQHVLRALGCTDVDEVPSGEHALRLLARRHYDLVISNWELAGMSGQALVQAIRHTAALQAVPVVIATPVTPTVVAEAAQSGVSAFLPRPFSPQSLEQLLRIFLGRPLNPGPSRPDFLS